MLKFSAKVRKVYPEDPTIFEELQELYVDARKYLRSELKPHDMSFGARLPHKTNALLQVGLRRAIELTESTVRELNASAFVPSFVALRALFETACVMYYTWSRVASFLAPDSPDELEILDDDIMKMLLGSRTEGWGGETQSKNILTIIGHVDKLFDGAPRRRYDELSEFAHPNYIGMLHAYQRLDEQQRAIAIDPWRENANFLPMLLGSISFSLLIINRSLEEFEESLPRFIRGQIGSGLAIQYPPC